MWHGFLVFAIVFIFHRASSQSYYGSVTFPQEQNPQPKPCWSRLVQNGTCKRPPECPAFLSKVQTEENSVSFLLIGDSCSFRKGARSPLMVCCPRESEKWTTTKPAKTTITTLPPPRTTELSRPTKRTTQVTKNTQLPTSTESSWETTTESRKRGTHPNRSLLPENSCGIMIPERILGGSIAGIDEFPWLALLEYRDPKGVRSYDCSGVLISHRYVLTAAHCTHGVQVTAKGQTLTQVILGEWDTSTDRDCSSPEVCSQPVQSIAIDEIIAHRNYRPRQKSQYNDISLIRLKRDAQITKYVQPICLPIDDLAEKDYEGVRMLSAGWGKTTNRKNSASVKKQKVALPVSPWETCKDFYKSFYNITLTRTQICAGGEEGKDTCQGDSGGPLMTTQTMGTEIRWLTVGIVSTGPAACGVQDKPAIYTNVPSYIGWILDNLKA